MLGRRNSWGSGLLVGFRKPMIDRSPFAASEESFGSGLAPGVAPGLGGVAASKVS